MLVLVRGGGDIATGVVQKLWRGGFQVAVLETETPTTIRCTVAVSSAVQDKYTQVEDLCARLAATRAEIQACFDKGEIPVLVDPGCRWVEELRPPFLVDAILAKKNLGTKRDMAPVTLALGPGFSAPQDVDAVVETMRGHTLGRLIRQGSALPNTGVPGELGGKSAERVVHAPCGGLVWHCRQIGDQVRQGETLFTIDGTPVPSPLNGVLRGLIAQGLHVEQGLKVADVDPRPAAEVDFTTISDKARCIGGAVLEGCLLLGREKGLLPGWQG